MHFHASLSPQISVSWNIFYSTTALKKEKVSPLQAMKAHGGCGCKGPYIAATALGRGRRLALRSASLSSGKLRYSIYRRLNSPHEQSGRGGPKKNLSYFLYLFLVGRYYLNQRSPAQCTLVQASLTRKHDRDIVAGNR